MLQFREAFDIQEIHAQDRLLTFPHSPDIVALRAWGLSQAPNPAQLGTAQ